jgi:hypothetical protein
LVGVAMSLSMVTLVLLLLLLLLLLLMLLMLLSTNSDKGILFQKDTDNTCSDFMVDNGLVVFPDNIDTEFLYQND